MASARIKGKQIDLDLMHRDGWRLVQQGLATMVRIAQSDDLTLALKAGQWLVGYGENLLAEQRAKAHPQVAVRPQPTRSEIISELRGLYAKALGPSPLIVDAKPEAAAEVSPTQSPE